MDVTIIKEEAFSVIGKVGQGPAHLGGEWIPPLWEKANNSFSEISTLAKYDEKGKKVFKILCIKSMKAFLFYKEIILNTSE